MLLNFAWLIPGLPIISSLLLTTLLLSFSKTMNRLTKPISYIIILSLLFSEILDFILFKTGMSVNNYLFGGNYVLFFDRSSLLFAESIGLVLLFIMILSVSRLNRRNGYVRYFISLGFLSGFSFLISFSGSFFHHFYDPLISYIDKILISF